MPAVSKKQQRYFGYLLSNPEERKKKGISKKAAKDFAQDVKEGAAWTKKSGKNPEGGLNEKGRKSYERDNPGSDLKAPQPEGGSRKKSFCARMGGMKKKLTSSKTANDPDSRINKALRKWKCNEVAPPGWGHTKAEKEKTKPWKPKSKIGGTAAAFKRALDDGRFKGLPGSKTKKEKTADMFKLMWSMKKKGDHPHYKPGTDKKYKKYEEDWKPEIEHVKGSDLRKKAAEKKRKAAADSLPPHLKLDVMKKAFASTNEEMTYQEAIDAGWEMTGEGIWMPPQIEEEITPSPNVSRKDRKAIDKRFKGLFKKDLKGTVAGVNEDSYVKDYEKLKKKIGSKEKHDKPAIKEGNSYQDWQKAAREAHARVKQTKLSQHKKNAEDLYKERNKGIKFYDKKGSGRIIGGRKKYD